MKEFAISLTMQLLAVGLISGALAALCRNAAFRQIAQFIGGLLVLLTLLRAGAQLLPQKAFWKDAVWEMQTADAYGEQAQQAVGDAMSRAITEKARKAGIACEIRLLFPQADTLSLVPNGAVVIADKQTALAREQAENLLREECQLTKEQVEWSES